MTEPASDPIADYVEAENAKERGETIAAPEPEPVVEAAPPAAEVAEVEAEAPAGDTEPQIAKPEEPQFDRWEDPDTGEVLDMRTRRAKRIKKLWQENQDFKREIEALKARSVDKPSQPVAADPQVSTRPTAQDARPKLENFETVEAWKDADDDWKEAQRTARTSKEQAAQRAQAAVAEHQAREAAARTKYPDYDAVVGRPLPFALPSHLQQQLVESAQSADLVYYLAQHPDELRSLITQPETSSARLLGRIEQKLESAAQPKPAPAKSAAPPPGQPLKTTTPTAGLTVDQLVNDVDTYVETVNRNPRLIGASR